MMTTERICRKIATLPMSDTRDFPTADLEYRNSLAGYDGEFFVIQFYRRDRRGVKLCKESVGFDTESQAREWFLKNN